MPAAVAADYADVDDDDYTHTLNIMPPSKYPVPIEHPGDQIIKSFRNHPDIAKHPDINQNHHKVSRHPNI